MGKILHCCAILLFATLSAQAAEPAAQSLRVGFVNVARIESESAMAKQSAEMLRKEFAPRERQLLEMQKQGNDLQADLEKNSVTMSPSDRQAKEKKLAAMAQQYQQMQRSVLEDLEARKRESFAGFLAELNVIIKNVAEAGKYDLIVQQAVYSSSQVDITDQVMKEIAKRASAPGK